MILNHRGGWRAIRIGMVTASLTGCTCASAAWPVATSGVQLAGLGHDVSRTACGPRQAQPFAAWVKLGRLPPVYLPPGWAGFTSRPPQASCPSDPPRCGSSLPASSLKMRSLRYFGQQLCRPRLRCHPLGAIPAQVNQWRPPRHRPLPRGLAAPLPIQRSEKPRFSVKVERAIVPPAKAQAAFALNGRQPPGLHAFLHG